MFKSITLVLLAAALFASCGKGNFNGQYAGTEITVYSGQQNVASGSALTNAVTLELQQSNDVLTGTYYKAGQAVGTINAKVSSNDRIDNVQLFIGNSYNNGYYNNSYYNNYYNYGLNGYMPSCSGMYVGSLTSTSDNGTLNGTLSPQSASSNTVSCGSIQIMVQRGAQDRATPAAVNAAQPAQAQ